MSLTKLGSVNELRINSKTGDVSANVETVLSLAWGPCIGGCEHS